MATFTRIFEGADRQARHMMLADLIQPMLSAGTREHRDADIAAMKLAMSDPSLLTEPLTSEFGVQVYRYQRGGRHDPTGTAGTWLMMAAERGMIRTVRYMLEQGVHPDDPAVFMSGGLLSTRRWATASDGVELAVQFGANPDVQIQPTVDGRWAGTPAQVQVRMLGEAQTDPTAPLRRLSLLLGAGAKHSTVDVDLSYRAVKMPAVTAVHAIAAHRMGNTHEFTALAIPVLRQLAASGADLDSKGKDGDAPLLAAMRNQSIDLVCALIELGCRTDGISSRKPDATLFEVAAEVMPKHAEAVCAAANARVMRDQMAASSGQLETEASGPSPKPARRMARAGI